LRISKFDFLNSKQESTRMPVLFYVAECEKRAIIRTCIIAGK
jgi:hypothetical protein